MFRCTLTTFSGLNVKSINETSYLQIYHIYHIYNVLLKS